MPSVPQNVLTYQARRGSRPILPNVALGIAIAALLLTAVAIFILMTSRISGTGTDFGGAIAVLSGFGLLALSAAFELVAIILSFIALRWHFHHLCARIACILCGATLLVFVLCFLAIGLAK